MKSNLAIAAIVLLTSLSIQAQTCLPGGATFTVQAQVDNFQTANPGCTMIEGGLSVLSATITNLNNLSVIESVGGDLYISNNEALINLNGLNNLTSVGGAIRIQNNAALTNLDGLESLAAARGDYFYVSDNPMLNSIAGLGSLDSVAGIFQIWSHDLLTSLTGLENLEFVGQNIAIFRHQTLTTLNGLENLAVVGADLRITENAVLTDISALNHPIDIQGALVIVENPSLSDCNVIAVCEYIPAPATFVAIADNTGACNSTAAVLASCTSAASDAELQARISIAPNPVSDVLRISGEGILIEGVQVRDAVGRLVYETQTALNEVNLADLASGVYFLEILVEDQSLVKRIVKQ